MFTVHSGWKFEPRPLEGFFESQALGLHGLDSFESSKFSDDKFELQHFEGLLESLGKY